PPAAVVDDSVFALYLPVAWQGRPRPVTVTAVFPRAGRRELLTVQDLGIQSTTLNRDPAALRHITVTGGENRLVHLWLGADGRLAKVDEPSRRHFDLQPSLSPTPSRSPGSITPPTSRPYTTGRRRRGAYGTPGRVCGSQRDRRRRPWPPRARAAEPPPPPLSRRAFPGGLQPQPPSLLAH